MCNNSCRKYSKEFLFWHKAYKCRFDYLKVGNYLEMNKEEQIPLVVHKTIESYLDKRNGLFKKVSSDKDFIRFKVSAIECKSYQFRASRNCK